MNRLDMRTYTDVTEDAAFDARFAGHAPFAREIEKRGLRLLCRFTRSVNTEPPSTLDWSVFLSEDACTSLSITIIRGTPSIYLATKLADGRILETEWWPSRNTLWSLGPFVFANDRPARRFKRISSRSIATALDVHARATSRAGSEPRPWDRGSYLAFREASNTLMQMNRATKGMLEMFALPVYLIAVLAFLVATRPVWFVWPIALGAFVISWRLFLSKLTLWLMYGVTKLVPMRTRARLAEWDKALSKTEDD